MLPCVIVLLTVGVMVTPAQARKRHHAVWQCRRGHAYRVVADSRAEVFEISSGDEPRYEGCAYGSTHRYALGPIPGGSSSGSWGSYSYTLVGTTLAFTKVGCPGSLAPPGDQCSETLSVMNLRSGKRLHEVSVTNGQCNGSVRRLVLKEDGAVAWVTENATGIGEAPGGTSCVMRKDPLEVHALDRAGERLLASGTDVAAGSLKLAGSTVHWTQGGRLYSAVLN